MKTRWKFLIVAGFALDLFFTAAVFLNYNENGAQWDTMTMFAENLVNGRKFHYEEIHGIKELP